jgi:predicted peptidase
MRYLALLVAFVVVMSAGICVSAAESPAPGKQVEQTLEISDAASVAYLLYLPKAYQPDNKKWPLMLFLHGRGESFGPLQAVKKWGPPRMVERGDEFPYILVSPQCPPGHYWSDVKQQSRVLQLLDVITKTYAVDKNRLYLTGLNMGGDGTWRLVADNPRRFAAAVPICGIGVPEDAYRLAKLPIWVFHGDQDRSVPIERSVEMVKAIRASGSKKIRFTTLEGIGHNSWSSAYAPPDLYKWLKGQTASRNR